MEKSGLLCYKPCVSINPEYPYGKANRCYKTDKGSILKVFFQDSIARDLGVPLNGCPEGYEHGTLMCHKKCPKGFDRVDDTCWKRCPVALPYHCGMICTLNDLRCASSVVALGSAGVSTVDSGRTNPLAWLTGGMNMAVTMLNWPYCKNYPDHVEEKEDPMQKLIKELNSNIKMLGQSMQGSMQQLVGAIRDVPKILMKIPLEVAPTVAPAVTPEGGKPGTETKPPLKAQ